MSNLNAYSKLKGYKMFTYYIIEYLMNNNENIWKLLKYQDSNALEQPNLTFAEKGALIYNGEEKAELYNVFRDAFTDDAFESRTTQIRMYPYVNDSVNRMASIQDFIICPLAHVKINHLNDYTTRLDTMVEEIISTLNGAYIENLGTMYYDGKQRRTNSIRFTQSIGNNRNFEGVYIIMSCNLMNAE